MEVARALVDQRCKRCHNLDRVFVTVQSPEDWRKTVARMTDYAAGSTAALRAEEQKQIIDYLSNTQTPEAVKQRKAQVDSALSSGPGLIDQTAAAGLQPPIPASAYDAKTIGFVSLVALGMITLIVRRPKAGAGAPALTPARPMAETKSQPVVAPRPLNTPFLLELVHITQETPDTKTLRFVVHGQQRLDALPGQFLTFTFLFDGKRRSAATRSVPRRRGRVMWRSRRRGSTTAVSPYS
jgi:hypothetical protein